MSERTCLASSSRCMLPASNSASSGGSLRRQPTNCETGGAVPCAISKLMRASAAAMSAVRLPHCARSRVTAAAALGPPIGREGSEACPPAALPTATGAEAERVVAEAAQCPAAWWPEAWARRRQAVAAAAPRGASRPQRQLTTPPSPPAAAWWLPAQVRVDIPPNSFNERGVWGLAWQRRGRRRAHQVQAQALGVRGQVVARVQHSAQRGARPPAPGGWRVRSEVCCTGGAPAPRAAIAHPPRAHPVSTAAATAATNAACAFFTSTTVSIVRQHTAGRALLAPPTRMQRRRGRANRRPAPLLQAPPL